MPIFPSVNDRFLAKGYYEDIDSPHGVAVAEWSAGQLVTFSCVPLHTCTPARKETEIFQWQQPHSCGAKRTEPISFLPPQQYIISFGGMVLSQQTIRHIFSTMTNLKKQIMAILLTARLSPP